MVLPLTVSTHIPIHSRAPVRQQPDVLKIDPFPIIGFYLYHVISADQFNNWTTSGI